MRKKFLLMIFVLSLFTSMGGGWLHAQTKNGVLSTSAETITLFEDDFNDGNLDGWRLIDGDKDGNNWYLDTDKGYVVVLSYTNKALDPIDYIVTTNSFLIDESSVLTLKVRPKSDNATFIYDRYSVVVSEDNTNWEVIGGEEFTEPSELKLKSFNLSGYAGKTVYIGILCNSNDAGAWYAGVIIDDVKLTGAAPAAEPVAKIGDTPYATLAEAVAAAQNGETITLIDNVVLAERVTIPANKTLTIDLNGKSISMEESIIATAYAINNLGNLTITDGVGSGSINARGIYNGYGDGGANVTSATITVLGGTINAKGTNGGAAVYNYGIAEIKGGTFTSIGGYSLNSQSGASMTIADGVTANNGIYVSGATLVVDGGEISGNRSGCHVLYAWNSTVTIKGGEFYNNNSGNSTTMAAGTTELTINGGTFGIKDGRVPGNGNTWTSCLTDTQNSATMTVNGGTFNGGFRVQAGTSMTINGGSFNDVTGSGYNVNTGATVEVKGGTFTDAAAKNFATNNLAAGYELGVNGTVAEVVPAAKIGETPYTSFADALNAAKSMTGDVTVEIYEKVTMNQALAGSYNSIKFVGKDTDAEIYLDVQGYITATGKNVAFENLKLSKSEGGFITNAGFMNVAFGIYDVEEVTYTNCTFENGACASSGKVTFNGCTFKKSWDKYGLWAYGNVDVTVQGSTFADYRGIKMYAENGAVASVKKANLTVKNTDFSAVDNKPAIVLTYGKSVTLEDNTYSSTGVFELDLDGKPNGVAVTSDVAPTCINDNGACGVLVDGKIYTTVAQAAEVATSGSTVKLLHNSTETVEFPMGVTLEKNGFEAIGVTVVVPVAQIGTTPYKTLEDAFKVATSGCTIDILSDVTVDYNWDARYTGGKFTVPVTINGNGKTIKFTASVNDNNYQAPFRFEADATVKNLTIDMSEVTDNRFRAISSKGNLTVDGCKFIGKDETLNCRAIIFGEGAGANVGNLAIAITNSEFNIWKRGITDNENAQDVKTVTITGNTLTDAGVGVSAKETVTFTGNTVTGAYVNIKSYTAGNKLAVTATNNTLEANTDAAYNVIDAGGVVNAEGFKVVAKGNNFNGYVGTDRIWGEVWGNARESFVIKVLDANGNVMGTSSLNNIDGIIDGDVTVTWSILFNAPTPNPAAYWSMEWTTAPTINNMPAKVELWVDGVKVSGGNVVLNGPDDLNKIVAAVTDVDGKIISCHTSVADALTAATNGATVNLLWSEGKAPIAMNGAVFGKNVTITGTAKVDWSKGFLFVGRGGAGNATLTFDGANLTSASDNASYGIHVSGREKNTNNKYDGTLVIKNSTIELDYLINKGVMTLDKATLTVKNGFAIGGRPASETESGVDATATIALTNNSKVVVNNHNGMGLGYEAIGVMNVDATSTFETTQSFLVTAKGTMNIAGKATVAGTLTNNGAIVLTAAGATLTSSECGNVTTNVADYNVAYVGGAYKLVAKNYVAKVGDAKFETFAEALDAVEDGQTITLIEGVTGDEKSTEIEFTKDINFTITGKAPAYALPVVTFQNAEVTIKDAEILIPELDARQNAVINIVNSTIHDAGGNSIAKSYYNGTINIDKTSTVYMMQITTMGYINVAGTVNATWQTNVYGNGIISLAQGATFNTGALHLTGKDYSGRDNTDTDRVGKPATIVVDAATLNVGSVKSDNGADYSYNSSKGINVGTIDGKLALLDIKNGGAVNFYMANGQTTNFGAGATVNVAASTLKTISRDENGTVTLANMGNVVVTGNSQLDVKNYSGNAIQLNNGNLVDTYFAGRVDAFGTNNISGTTTIGGILGLGYETNPTEQVVVNITGNFNGNNVLVRTNNGVDNILNVGKADGERTKVHFGQLGAFADVNVVNTDVTYGYAFIRNDFNAVNSTFEIKGGVNTYFSGNAKVVLDNTTWDLSGYANIGSYGGYMYGNADVTLKNGSSMTATSLGVEVSGEKVVKLTLEDNSSLTATNLTNQGSIVLASTEATLTSNECGNVTTSVANQVVSYIDGKYTLVAAVAKIGDKYFTTLQAAINAVQNGETITVLRDIATNVEIKEKDNVKVTIDGNGMKMTGTIKVVALSSDNDRRITIKNFKFEDTTSASVDFITSVETNHYPRITVEGCTFTGSGDATDVALRLKSSKNVEIKNCTGTGLHSFLQNTSGWNLTIENVTVTESKSAFALGTVQGVTVKGCTVDVPGYGIRMDAGYNNNAVIESNTIKAFIPVVVRKATVNSNIAVNGTNNLTATNSDGIWCAIGTSEYEENGKLPTDATGEVTVTLNDNGLDAAGVYGDYVALAGAGTEAQPYLINTLKELEAFRNSVNKGETRYNAPGVYVALNADIDMTGINWVGIGSATAEHGFMGNFDGKNFKIKNLTITNPALDSDGYAYAGLFAVTEGTDKDNQNTIKNLTIENVTIKTTGHIAAAAIAYPYYTIVDNVKVCGDIAIKGGDYTSGVLAYTRRCVNASNLSIVGNEGSYVEGNQVVGGVISDIQMNGGLTADYKNFSAEGIAVTGIKNVGGISGIIATQTLDGASVKKVTLSGNAGVGIVSGALGGTSTISNVEYENVTGATTILGITYDGNAIEARIGDTYYATFAAAFATAQAGETITLLADINIANKIEIAKSITLDGNNNTLTYTGTDRAIDVPNNSNSDVDVTIKNLNVVATTANRGLNYNDNGKFNVENVTVTIGNNVDGYAINFPGMADNAIVTIKDSKLTSRNPLNIWGENMTIDVYNSEIISVDNSSTYDYAAIQLNNDNYGNVANGTVVNVYGGSLTALNEKNELSNVVANATETGVVNISDETVVTGKVLNYVANIGGAYFGSLQAAVNAIEKHGYNSPIVIMKDFTTSEATTIKNGLNVTINLNGKTITGTDNATGSFGLITNKGNLTVTGNGKITLTATNNRGWNAYSSVISNTVGGKLTVNSGTIEHLGGTDMAYGIDNLTNGKGTYAETVVNGGTVKSTYRAIRQFLNGVEAQNILTVNGGTIEGANKSIWMQDPSKNANTGSLTVGENATLNGDVYLFVTAGSTEWPVTVNIDAAALAEGSEVMTGNVPSGYEVALVGGNYGVFKGVAKIGTSYYASLQAAVNAVQNGETITLIKDVTENVTLTEQTGLYYTIDGAGKTMNGTITVKALSDTNDNRRITIKNINFVDTVNGRDFITSTETNHYPRLTVEGCSFTGTGKEAANTVAIRLKSSHSVVISNCTGTGLHSFLQNTSGWNLTIENVKVTESKSGLALGTVQGVTVKGCEIAVAGYGIRLDANTYNNNAVIENNKVTAFIPVVVRKVNTNSNITFQGANTMTANNADGYWCVIGATEYEENGKLPELGTGNVVVNLNTNLSYEGVYGNYAVAQIGEVKYATLQAAVNAVQNGETITVIRDIALTEAITVAAGAELTLDLNGKVVSYESAVVGEDMITNNGKLTIESSVAGGEITYKNTDETGANVTVNTISTVAGSELIINGGIIKNTSSANNTSKVLVPYAIDILTNGNLGDVNVTINGGTVYSDYMAIRQFNNSDVCKNTLVVNGGYIYGNRRAIQIHFKNNAAYTTISGGKIEANDYSLCFLTTSENILVEGGEFIGAVWYSGTKSFIKGGTYTTDVTEYVAPGYSCKQNTEGKYVVKFANVEIYYTAAGVETTKEQAAYSLSFAVTDYDNKEASVKIGSKKPTTKDRIEIVTPATVAFEGVEYKVTSLANKAFDGVRGIKEIIISEGVKSLGSRALANMYELVDVVFPSTLVSVGDNCFTGYGDNHKIKTITCLAATPPTASGHWETASFQMWVAENVILFVAGDANVYKKAAGWSRFTNILGINSEIEIPGNYYLYTMKVNVTSVSPRAASIKIGRRFPEGVPAILDTIPETASFYGIEFPITSIPEKGFQGVKFEKIVIPGNIKNIGNTAFGGSNLADTLIIEEGVETLGNFAFQGCYSLSEIILPSTLKSVGEKCFNNVGVASTNYEAVEVSLVYTGVTPPTAGANLFSNNIQGTLYVPNPDVVESFKAAAGWNISSIKPFEAKIGETVYYSLAKAIKASKAGDVITLIADVETAKANPIIIPEGVTLDINTHNITANIYGTVKTAGGLWTTVAVPGFNSRDMLGKNAIYNTTGATVVNLANEVKVLAGTIVLNPHPETEWWTLPGQSLSIATGATFEIPAGVKFTVREGNANVNGTLINNGTLAINAGATVTGNLTGDIHFLGGNFITADGYKMVGTTSEYFYKATNALVNIESTFGDITILSGEMTLGQSWRTVQGQTLTVAAGASFTVPTGMTFEVFANTHVVVEGTLVTDGTVYLQAGATVKAEAGLNIQTTVAGHVVDYNNGVYSVVEQTIFTQTIQLNAGWNWFSSYVETDLESLQTALRTSGVMIKTGDYFNEYLEGWGWDGNIESVSSSQMYMIQTSVAHELVLSGKLLENVEITLNNGWNWISFPMNTEVSVTEALANLQNANTGDIIKNGDAFAEYLEGWGWDGTLSTLEPGQGYMYYSNNETPVTFTYSPSSSKSAAKANVTTDGNYWTPNAAQFANNMTMTAVLDVENINYEVAAFVNGECRGSARPIYVEALDAYMLFLTIHGEEVEEMTFKYYDIDTDTEYTLSDRINYSNNAILGSLKEPYMFTRGTTGIGEAELSQLNIYPNPTTTAAEINLNATFDKVEVFNALGVKVAEYSNVDSIDALETAGIYVIRATNNSIISHCRLVVK